MEIPPCAAKSSESCKDANPLTPAAVEEIKEFIEQGVDDGVYPGAVLLLSRHGKIHYLHSVGSRMGGQAAQDSGQQIACDTVFDIAALTGVMATTTLVMKLVEAGKVELKDRMVRYIQGFGVNGKSPITIRQLLTHTSGLANWTPFYEELLRQHSGSRVGILTSPGARSYVIHALIRGEVKGAPGEKQCYSDNNMILLGHLVELLTGLSLEKAFFRLIAQPLGLKSTSFIDLAMIKRRGIHPVTDIIAPTEECPWRKRVMCGEVHDDNAWVMGGVAGHSGLFSTAGDIHLFASEMLAAWRGQSDFMKRETLEQFWCGGDSAGETAWRHGWDSPSRENGMLDAGLSPEAVGINGFTGCSLWLEPRAGLNVIFLSNRVHPSRANRKITAFRAELHKLVLGHFA